MPKNPMKIRPQEALTEKETELILRIARGTPKAGLRDYCILALMLLTGLRRAEIASLKRGNLRNYRKGIWLEVWGKGEKYRIIPLKNRQLIVALGNYFREVNTLSEPEAPMFFTLSKRGGRPIQAITPATIRRVVEKYALLSSIEKRITSHTLRHTFLTRALQKGATLATIRKLAGHSNVQTTSRYLHSSEEEMEKAIEKLGL